MSEQLTPERANIERTVLDLTVAVCQKKRWMQTQPWHGNPVNPPDRRQVNRELRELEWALEDAVDELTDLCGLSVDREDRRDPDWMKGIADSLRFPPKEETVLADERAVADDLYGVVGQALVWLDRVGINLRGDEHVTEVLAHYEEMRSR